MRRFLLRGLAPVAGLLLTAAGLHAQILTRVEIHSDNESPETAGSPIEQTHLDGPSRFSQGPAISPDGRHVYVTSFSDDAVTVFQRDPSTGVLTLVEVHADNESPEAGGAPIEQTHLEGVRGIAISPDGNHIYVTSTLDEAITVFRRHSDTGALTLVEVHEDDEATETGGSPTEQTHLDGATFPAISPDGNHVYVSSTLDEAVTVFQRDSGTGILTLVEVHADDDSFENSGDPIEQDYLQGALDLAISPDGNHLYVTALADDAVTVFRRNSDTGALTLVEVHDDDASTETLGSPTEQTHLENPAGVAISPDGSHVYVTSELDDAVTVFRRNSGTGALTLVEAHDDNASPETDGSPIEQTHLEAPRGLAVNNRYVLVASGDDDAVVVFDRNPDTGALIPAEIHADESSSETGGSPMQQTHLELPVGIAISPDGGHVYLTANEDDAITVLSSITVPVELLTFTVTPGGH